MRKDEDAGVYQSDPSNANADTRAKTRPKRRSRLARSQLVIFLNFCLSLVFFGALAAGAAMYWGKGEFENAGPLRSETSFVVARNSSLNAIADNLEERGVVSSSQIFKIGAKIAGVGSQLKAGEYAFDAGVSMRDVMEKIARGDSVQHAITVPEGWTVQRAYQRIADSDVLTGQMPDMPPEGMLQAETHMVQRGMTREQLVQSMRDAQEAMVRSIWEGRQEGLPIEDIGQFVTLASIVERETGIASERPHVASVFVNRLRQGMRLQSDPTFLYGIYGGAGKPSDAPITRADIESDTPYNTYRINGLPPGPIAIPGRDALEAVAHPLDTDDVYFVADGTGGHVFAETLEEHNRNVQKYRAIERERRADAQ
ncbi:endolytic transglycosylase MltG [Fulvimarina sp. 2208YS6-2-32]|uniref:Endolytic murein transglycosylase n=1 Tax=Fulvimarina uroteuthidis TaxID=3098149 RepID=A0ABU5I513_9HYPH|nr:endolytic transglycosylase MltG [Fulvimarina sp. 2208YS6-2-32]MDY8110459.1 endolytic transglycosylase MltG [Fulvimarina sp. 2208YS6-2-32]